MGGWDGMGWDGGWDVQGGWSAEGGVLCEGRVLGVENWGLRGFPLCVQLFAAPHSTPPPSNRSLMNNFIWSNVPAAR
jgi:hypothetical protein